MDSESISFSQKSAQTQAETSAVVYEQTATKPDGSSTTSKSTYQQSKSITREQTTTLEMKRSWESCQNNYISRQVKKWQARQLLANRYPLKYQNAKALFFKLASLFTRKPNEDNKRSQDRLAEIHGFDNEGHAIMEFIPLTPAEFPLTECWAHEKFTRLILLDPTEREQCEQLIEELKVKQDLILTWAHGDEAKRRKAELAVVCASRREPDQGKVEVQTHDFWNARENVEKDRLDPEYIRWSKRGRHYLFKTISDIDLYDGAIKTNKIDLEHYKARVTEGMKYGALARRISAIKTRLEGDTADLRTAFATQHFLERCVLLKGMPPEVAHWEPDGEARNVLANTGFGWSLEKGSHGQLLKKYFGIHNIGHRITAALGVEFPIPFRKSHPLDTTWSKMSVSLTGAPDDTNYVEIWLPNYVWREIFGTSSTGHDWASGQSEEDFRASMLAGVEASDPGGSCYTYEYKEGETLRRISLNPLLSDDKCFKPFIEQCERVQLERDRKNHDACVKRIEKQDEEKDEQRKLVHEQHGPSLRQSSILNWYNHA